MCKRIKAAIKESYVMNQSVIVDEFGWGKNDISSPISNLVNSCLSEQLTIEMEEDVEEVLCRFNSTNNVFFDINWYSTNWTTMRLDPYAYVNNRIATSYYVCDPSYLSIQTPTSINMRSADNFEYSDAFGNIIHGIDPDVFGNVRIALGNVKRGSNDECSFDILYCNQYSFAFSSDESSFKVLDFFRNFNWNQVVDVRTDDNSITDPNIAEGESRDHYMMYNSFFITLDRDYTYKEISNAIKTGMFDWSACF